MPAPAVSPSSSSSSPSPRGASLYERLGGDAGVRGLTSAAIDAALADSGLRDPRKTIWRDAPDVHVSALKNELARMLASQTGARTSAVELVETRDLFARMAFSDEEWNVLIAALGRAATGRGVTADDKRTLESYLASMKFWATRELPERLSSLRKRAALDLECSEDKLTITALDGYDNEKGVVGCSKRASHRHTGEGWKR